MTRAPVRHPQPPTLDVADVGWQELARCAGTDLGLWHIPSADEWREAPGQRAEREREAKALCARCDVRDTCLEWAFEVDDWYAILGGTTPDERRRMRRIPPVRAGDSDARSTPRGR